MKTNLNSKLRNLTVADCLLGIVFVAALVVAATMAFRGDFRKTTILSTKETIDIRIPSGTRVVAFRILKQESGTFDQYWYFSPDQSLEHDTIVRDVLFQKQQDDGKEEPATKGDLEYRIAKIK